MTATLTIDPTGAVALPKAFLEKFALKPGAKLNAEVNDVGLALSPADEEGTRVAILVERDGFVVIGGTEPFDAVEAVADARRERAQAAHPRST